MNPTEDVLPGTKAPRVPAPDDPRVVQALEEYSAALKAGHKPDRHDFPARYPEVAEVLAECLEGLEFVRAAAPHLQPPAGGHPASAAAEEFQPEGPLGDYRIVREVGRGDMGVVYEAVQISLGRQVALKVLPFAAGLDSRQLLRFKNEAQAAAQLRHQSIVPVYGVGVERGVHYYAMQFIDGQTLAAVIGERRRTVAPDRRDEPGGSAGAADATGPYAPTPPVAALSTERTGRDPAFFRTAARFGEQAALALEHAHQFGVIHRDIKPANLLVDVRGDLWITDFGLAHCQSQAGLTMTGDLVGTLRYMSPEQALAQRVAVDHRTDIYSLGATLYELLTLEPAFAGRDRQELLRQIAFEEPRRPRQLNKAIPLELETIVLKALEKNPAERYGTAQELAEDLERFLKDEPIRAKRPSLVQRARKWARRHRPVVASGLVATAVVVAIAIVALLISLGNISAALTEKSAALAEKSAALEREKGTTYLQGIALAGRELAAGNVGRAEELLEECPEHLRGWEWHFLKRQRYGNVAPFQHSATVIHVVFSPDGRQIASVCMDGRLAIRDARTGVVLHALERPAVLLGGALVRGMAYSLDGRYLAVARNDGLIRVWEAGSGQLVHTLEGHKKGPAWQVAFSPDSRTLASCGSDRRVRLWDLASGKVLQVFRDHPSAVKGVAFRPDGRSVVAACDDGTVKVWDRETRRQTFSFRGDLLAYPLSPRFSADARRLAWAGLDDVIKIWDTTTGRLQIDQPSNTHRCRAVAFSPDGRRIALAGFDGTLRLLDAVTGREMLTIFAHPSHVAGVAFSPDGNKLASASYDHTVRIWDATPLDGDPQAAHCVTLTGHKDKVSGVAFSSDGRWLASASWDHTVKLWELAGVGPASRAGPEADVPLGSRHRPAPGNITLRHTLRGHRGLVTGVAFSSDQRTVASASWDNTVKLWDLQGPSGDSLTPRRSIPLTRRVFSIAFSPDGQLLAIGQDNGIALYDPATARPVHPFKGTPAPVPCVAFHPHRPLLISTGASDSAVKAWAVAAAEFSFEIRHYSNPNPCVAVSPDGRRIAGPLPEKAGDDHTVKVWNVDWDAKTYTPFRTLKGHRNYVWKVAFSPDGRYLASGSWDSTVKVWDLRAAESAEPVTLRGHAGYIHGLAFSPDGRRLASGSGYFRHGEVKVWDASLWDDKAKRGR
jgi:eukaryotic-like serine/threonine-protein kinase